MVVVVELVNETVSAGPVGTGAVLVVVVTVVVVELLLIG